MEISLKTPFLIIMIGLGQLTAWCQDKNIVSKLKAYTEKHITEKAYLHFDKPYYAAGDTIYFKAYVTSGERHELSKVSGVLHVDLINTSKKIDQTLKLQVIGGVAWGVFTLPDSLPKGSYHSRAYTQWMRNKGDDAYFDQVIPIGSALSKIPESGSYHAATAKGKPDLQFFPEGGGLVTGIQSKVAFKAVGPNGLGMAAKGTITDNLGKEIATLADTRLGLGYFYVTPESGKTYTANITYADGSRNIVNLPLAASKGIVLQINNDSLGSARIQITANEDYFAENHDKQVNLLIYSGGIAAMVPVKLDSTSISLAILKRHLHSGITRITLFSSDDEPLSERLIFIQNPDQLKLTINTDKTGYNKREKVLVHINALTRADSAASGHFSVAVIDESKVLVDENSETTIFNNLLLTSELKGFIEQPNYYFTNVSAKTRNDLDLVMLTHGYRRFEWKQLLNNDYPPVAYQPEHNLEISGTAKNGFGTPLANATVSLIPLHGGTFISEKTDNKGSFHFRNLLFNDSTHFMLQAVNARGKNTTQITYNHDPAGPAVATNPSPLLDDVNMQMAGYLENSKEQLIDHAKYSIVDGKVLKEVKIQGKKRDNDYPSSNITGPGHADQVMHRKDIQQIGGQLSTSLIGRLHGIDLLDSRTEGGVPYLRGLSSGPMLIVADGVELPIGTGVNRFNPNDVETVEVLKLGNAGIYGMAGGNGVLVITTRQGGQDPRDIKAVGLLPITAKGFYKAREFYSPKYEHPDDNAARKDLRSTIYWNPELLTDKDGNASFEYYNADGIGSYRLVIEGIDEKGNLGRQVYRYKVE